MLGLVVAFGVQAGWRFAVARRVASCLLGCRTAGGGGQRQGKGRVPRVPNAIKDASANPSYANVGNRAREALAIEVLRSVLGAAQREVHFGIAMKASGSFRFMPSMSACMYVCMLACTHACVCIGIVATGFAEVLSTVDGQNLAPLSVGGTCTLALPF